MKINRNNYEAFFLDYHEGNLDEQSGKEVLAFVASNPDLKEEFESFEMISLHERSNVKFPGKQSLKKNAVTEYNYKTWFVAYEENDLTKEEKREVEQFIEVNPAFKPELEILKQTRVRPDYSIRYENKSSLKKGAVVIPMWVRMAAAACLVFGLLGYWLVMRNPAPEMVQSIPPKTAAPSPIPEKDLHKDLIQVAEGMPPAPVKNNSPRKEKNRAPHKQVEVKTGENLAKNEPAPVMQQETEPVTQPLASNANIQNPESQTVIVINENKPQSDGAGQKLVVLDDNDLAELGLKEKTEVENNSLFGDAINGVGKVFGVNAHYTTEKDPVQSRYKETIAMGPLAVTRTVAR